MTLLSKETICELLEYLAEHETFPSLAKVKNFSKDEVSEILKFLADSLRKEDIEESAEKIEMGDYDLSHQVKNIVTSLSPREEKILFRSFRLTNR